VEIGRCYMTALAWCYDLYRKSTAILQKRIA
jgi:hypothetical protein